jgi:hypothetical protein
MPTITAAMTDIHDVRIIAKRAQDRLAAHHSVTGTWLGVRLWEDWEMRITRRETPEIARMCVAMAANGLNGVGAVRLRPGCHGDIL